MKQLHLNFILGVLFTILSLFAACSNGGNSGNSNGSEGGKFSQPWNGSVDTDWYNTSETEFTINTAEQFAGFAKLVNDGNDFGGKTIKLGINIALNNTQNWQDWANNPPANTWTPIGTWVPSDASARRLFNGTFDGADYVISGVYINSTKEYQGLFGSITAEGTMIGMVKNLGVVDSYIKGSKTVGGLVGYNRSLIGNSYSKAWVTGIEEIGGLAGQNDGTIISSYFTGEVLQGSFVGGLTGRNRSTISNCYSTGKVMGDRLVGGFVGYNNGGVINNSYSTGVVEGAESVGGFAGGGNSNHQIINSYYNKETSGQSDEGKGEGKTTAEMKIKSTFVEWDFEHFWGISGNKNGGYPYLLFLYGDFSL